MKDYTYLVSLFSELGLEVGKYLNKGELVPDETMISLVGKEVEYLGQRNWLLDGEWMDNFRKKTSNYRNVFATGFPRTVSQAEKLQQSHPVNLVINLVVPHSVILKRVEGRWVHLPSGRVYNVGFNAPKISVSFRTRITNQVKRLLFVHYLFIGEGRYHRRTFGTTSR